MVICTVRSHCSALTGLFSPDAERLSDAGVRLADGVTELPNSTMSFWTTIYSGRPGADVGGCSVTEAKVRTVTCSS